MHLPVGDPQRLPGHIFLVYTCKSARTVLQRATSQPYTGKLVGSAFAVTATPSASAASATTEGPTTPLAPALAPLPEGCGLAAVARLTGPYGNSFVICAPVAENDDGECYGSEGVYG